VIDGAEEYRAEPGSERNASDQTNIFTRQRWSEIVVESRRVHVKDRLQVAIFEPVEVDDNGDIFERQRINGTDRIFLKWTLPSYSIQTSLARIAWLESSLDWTVL